MRTDVWERQKTHANAVLAPCVAEVVSKAKRPFVQVVTDMICPRATALNGKVLIVGDALATLRPMSAMGTSQAAKSVVDLLEVLSGKMVIEEYERKALAFANESRELGVVREAFWAMSPTIEDAKSGQDNGV